MRRTTLGIGTLVLSLSLPGWGQHSGHHGSSQPAAGAATQPEDADVAGFKHAIAEQATDEQIGQYHLMVKSTEAARRQAQELERLASNQGNSDGFTAKATTLQDSVDRALTDTRNFRRSFTDSQEATLKVLAKKLNKSDTAVGKSAKSLATQFEQATPEPHKVVGTAANLEKELVALQSDQSELGKHMGIPSY